MTANKLPTPQPLRLLCADDIIRNPATGRLVRIENGGERGNVFTGIPGRDLETGEDVIVTLRNTTRVSVYID